MSVVKPENISRMYSGAASVKPRSVLQQGRQFIRAFTAATVTLCIWGFVYPRPYKLVIALLAIFPWIGLAIVWRSDGAFRVDQTPKSKHPSIGFAFVLPGLALAMRGLTDFNILLATPFWLIAAGFSILLFAAALVADPTMRSQWATAAGLVFICSAYGCGLTVLSNALLDHSHEMVYSAHVERKYISHGRSASYHVGLSPWGPREQSNSIQVPSKVYVNVQPGDTAQIVLRQGAFHIPWYFVREWHRP